MRKLNSIQHYTHVKEGEAVTFTVSEAHLKKNGRIIKLSVNTPDEIRLYVGALPETFDKETGELTSPEYFLGVVDRTAEKFEFAYQGDFVLRSVGGDVWIDTLDSANFVVEKADEGNYARVYERPEEDPIMTQMKFIARQNERQRQLDREQDRIAYEARIAALEAKAQANVTSPATPPATPAPSAPAGGATMGASDDNGAAQPPAGGTGGESDANGGT